MVRCFKTPFVCAPLCAVLLLGCIRTKQCPNISDPYTLAQKAPLSSDSWTLLSFPFILLLTNRWQPQPVQAVDFTNDAAVEWYLARLTKFQRDYGIDGFKFDGGEPCFLPKNFKTKRRLQHPSEYTRAYLTRIAGKFQNGCSEVRTGSRTTNLALLTRMGDRFSVWSTSNGLRSLIPTLLTSSVLGYPFALPDMIGGNAYGLHRPTKGALR